MVFIPDVIVFQSTVHVGEFIPTSLHSNIINFLDRATGIYNILRKDGVAHGLVRAFLADALSEFIKHTQSTSISFERKIICVACSFLFQLMFCLALLQ